MRRRGEWAAEGVASDDVNVTFSKIKLGLWGTESSSCHPMLLPPTGQKALKSGTCRHIQEHGRRFLL